MLLRLMLLIPLVRQFMLLDVSIMPDGSEPMGRMERERSEIPLLLARAVVNMHEHGWGPAEALDLWVGERYVRSRWWHIFGKPEKIYETMRVVEMGFGVYLTDTGLVFHETLRGSPSGLTGRGPVMLVSRPARIASWQVSSLHKGLSYLADYSPANS